MPQALNFTLLFLDQHLRHFLAELMNVVERAPRYLGDDHADRINYVGNAALTAYGLLATRCLDAGLGYFQLRPKLHVAWAPHYFFLFSRSHLADLGTGGY